MPACQWRSQDIADARAQHGYTTFVRTSARSAEALGDLGQAPKKILQPPKSVLKPYVYGKLACGERMRLIILWIIHSDTAPFDFKTV